LIMLPSGWARAWAVRDIERQAACAYRMLRFAAVLCLLVAMIDSFIPSPQESA